MVVLFLVCIVALLLIGTKEREMRQKKALVGNNEIGDNGVCSGKTK